MQSINIKGHINKITESYSSILRFSVNHSHNLYDDSILEKCITCIEHIFKATYILTLDNSIDFDKINNLDLLDRILNTHFKNRDDLKDVKSLNKILGLILTEKGYLPKEYFNIYSSLNKERNKVTHKKGIVSQEVVYKGLTKIKTICNWFFSEIEEYDWEERYIEANLRAYETSFMERLGEYLNKRDNNWNKGKDRGTTNNKDDEIKKEKTKTKPKINRSLVWLIGILVMATVVLVILQAKSKKGISTTSDKTNDTEKTEKPVMDSSTKGGIDIKKPEKGKTPKNEKETNQPSIDNEAKFVKNKETSTVSVSDTIEKTISNYILNDEFKNRAGTNEMAVLIINGSNNTIADITPKIASVFLKNMGYNNTASLLSREFVNDGLFEKIFNGVKFDFTKYNFKDYADYFCLGKINIESGQSDDRQDMTKATINLEMKVIKTTNGGVVNQFTVPYPYNIGAGFSKQQAAEVATNNIITYLKNYKYEN